MEIQQGQSFTLNLPELAQDATPLRLLWVNPGTFIMGPLPDQPGFGYQYYGEEWNFECTLTQGYWLGQYPVTQAHWQAVMGNNPSHFYNVSQDCPVENVNWDDATQFCGTLNQRFCSLIPDGYELGLPTEAQWEYACRANTQTLYYTGDDIEGLERAAWHKGNSGGHTQPVGLKVPNAWGFHDILGNVCEWCCDLMGSYPHEPATDWIGDGTNAANGTRPARSASWNETLTIKSENFTCYVRNDLESNARGSSIGFRLSLRPKL